MNLKENVAQLIGAVTDRSKSYLSGDLGLEITGTKFQLRDVRELALRDLTSLVSVGGNLGMYIAFSFDEPVMRTVFEAFTDGLDIDPEEESMYMEETAGEVINTIIGNALAEMPAEQGQTIALTPPVVLTQARIITRQKQAYFYSADLTTARGVMTVMCVGPKALFDEKLNYQES